MNTTIESTPQPQPSSAPWFVRATSGLTSRLLGYGVPMGPNTVLTVRGRKSGRLYSLPVAVVELEGRRWVIGAYGEVNWVRNLRAAGEATIRVDGRETPVEAIPLTRDDATSFYRDRLYPYVARFPALGRGFARLLMRVIAPELLHDPAEAARLRPVFELVAKPA